MPAEIAIIHGWSDSSKSFGALKAFLEENGYETSRFEQTLSDIAIAFKRQELH